MRAVPVIGDEGVDLDSRSYVFFFQAEDGIRDSSVTGVQTCALPISVRTAGAFARRYASQRATNGSKHLERWFVQGTFGHHLLLMDDSKRQLRRIRFDRIQDLVEQRGMLLLRLFKLISELVQVFGGIRERLKLLVGATGFICH